MLHIQHDGNELVEILSPVNHFQTFTRHYGSEKLAHVATVHHC